jgi:HK97 family phage major capsid protein
MKLAVRKNKYKPKFVGLNSTDIDKIQSLKDQLDNSISDRRLVFNADGDLVKIAGLRVVENDYITADTAIVGDTAQAMIGVRKAMTMEIGLNSTDFTEGQKTVRLGLRLAFGVRDKAAFQYSSGLTADLATIAAGA